MTTRLCVSNPEPWVCDDDQLRSEAARECLTCPALEACRRAVEDDPSLRFGAIAGVDYGTAQKPKDTSVAPADDTRECAQCGTVFARVHKEAEARWAGRRFCSNQCVADSRRQDKPTKPCEGCGKDFKRTYHSQTQWAVARFCGNKCANVARVAERRQAAA